MRILISILFVYLAGLLVPQDDGRALCEASWTQVDTDSDGILDGREATAPLAMMYLHKVVPPEDGRISRARYIDECLAGTFRTGYLPD